jgi:DNA processing protein
MEACGRKEDVAGHAYDILAGHCDLSKPIVQEFPFVSEQLNVDIQEIQKAYDHCCACFEKLPQDAIVLDKDDAQWPSQINDFPYCPRFLYVQGRTELLAQKSLAVVGTFAPSPWGKEYAEKTADALNKEGVLVASGLALGIDGYAQARCIRDFAPTLAVIATSLGQYYPPEHEKIQRFIAEEGGVVVTRFAPSAPAEKWHLLFRNRLMSALTVGSVIVEDREAGNGVRQAKFALGYGRKLYLYIHLVNDGNFQWPKVYAKKNGVVVVKTPQELARLISGRKITRKKKGNAAEQDVQLSLFDDM